MKLFHICLGLIALLGLGACTTSTTAAGPNNDLPPCATDLKDDVIVTDQGLGYQKPPACQAVTVGSEMYDRERGFISPIEGGGIIVSEIVGGWTNFR